MSSIQDAGLQFIFCYIKDIRGFKNSVMSKRRKELKCMA